MGPLHILPMRTDDKAACKLLVKHKQPPTHPHKFKFKEEANNQMIAFLFTITFQLLALINTVQDNIIPERRQQMKRQKLRNDFYDGSLLKRRRGGRGVVNLNSSGNIASSGPISHINNNSLSMADTISMVLVFIAAVSYVHGM